MTIKELITAALTPVLANSWAVELPKRPTWPATVFEVATEEEKGWCAGARYDQHVVSVFSLAKTVEELEALRPQIVAAMEVIPGYMGSEEEGDSEYEGDPEVYAYFQNFRIRTRTL
ncbi:hypothetical protein [Noviherbaspirillum saxi]|uniref:DUF3168 domain-containing protein n=1 Tax=Noviherbaspirillum saxi TaxID=2320863 RepID=A0A3A3FSI8_9BURK|nr:hypothetical protein [Noviherbaspirillum saxi]RJF99016.1 hypothetical protein D3871_11225 [Noviherbaspirillum saxi]